jgi:hypothetical protein
MTQVRSFFDDSPPRKDFWMLFKVSTYERLLQMQKGLLYMNSLDYFSNLPGEESLPLRMDELESVYGVLRAGPNSQGYSTLSVKVGESDKETDLGPKAVLTARFPRPKNYMLFCMSSFADGPDGKIPGEHEGKLYLDKRFLHFGSHLLLISNPSAFGDRISKAISNKKGIFGSKFFHDGFGLVDYKPLGNHSGPKGLYTKDSKYSWQRELRFAFGAEDHLLNRQGAFELNVGDLSDISQIISVQALVDEPMQVKRRSYRMVNGKPEQVMD